MLWVALRSLQLCLNQLHKCFGTRYTGEAEFVLLDLLVYAGLAKFAHVLSAAAAKAQLADMAKRLFLQQLDLFGQVNENTNGVLGVGSDSTRADSYYHWGALHALVAISEAGAYPSPML